MADFILEEQMEKVISPKTKEYLEEVVSCYRNGNYRASVVVLYTTMIFDLMQKLVVLKDVYNDKKAKSIYDEIKRQQGQNPNSPQWEAYLIEEICKQMQIISIVEKEELEHLKKERNYAAHPIINGDYELTLKPITKETAADLMRKAFEIVFLRDAILGRDISKEIVEDLNGYYVRMGEVGLKKYLYTKYVKRMNQERKDKLFTFLWRSVFEWNDKDCNKNRDSNFLGLLYLYEEEANYRQLIKDNEYKFLNKIAEETFESWLKQKGHNDINSTVIAEFKNTSRIISFIRFIELNPELYKYLNDYSKNIVESSIEKMYKNVVGQNGICNKEQDILELTAVFLRDNIKEHLTKILSDRNSIVLEKDDLKLILNQVDYKGHLEDFKDFLIDYCTMGNNFYDMCRHFDDIEICKDYYTEKDYYHILKKMDANSQIYNNDYICIKECGRGGWIEKLEKNFKEKFKRELVSSNEEKMLYYNLYCSLYSKLSHNIDFVHNWDFDKMLRLIDERASLYTKEELSGMNGILCKFGKNGNNLLDYMKNQQIKYQNIEMAIS